MKKDILNIKPINLVFHALVDHAPLSLILTEISSVEKPIGINEIKTELIKKYGMQEAIKKLIEICPELSLDQARDSLISETSKRVTKILKEQGVSISYFDVDIALSLGEIIADDVNLCVDDLGTPRTPEKADHDSCPKCDGVLIFGEPEPEGTKIFRTHSCEDCGFSYTEEYTLTKNYEEL